MTAEDEKRFILTSAATDETEQDLPPTGIAGNQGNFYTVSMNDVNSSYYATSPDVPVSPGMEQNPWATFVDNYVTEQNGIFVYTPVVETFAKGLNLSGQQRTDYNTYGGPLQEAPSGTMTVKMDQAEKIGNTWEQDGKKYCYYNLPLNVETLNIPEGYELYKARVWRKVDPSLLNESNPKLSDSEIQAHLVRLGNSEGEYMYDDINYDDSDLINVDNITSYVFGEEKFDDNYEGDLKMTFGAQKVRNESSETGVIDELPVQFTVRLYYTRNKSTNTKNRDDDATFYIVEKVYETTITGNDIYTAIEELSDANINKQVQQVTYYNALGQASSKPHSGVNVVATKYTDGSTRITKIVK